MREILFRGKTDKGEWVEGYVFDDDLKESNKMFIGYIVIENGIAIGQNFYEVIPETVGQYTGLTDKNGTKIFEGDIHEHIVGGKSYLFVVKHGKYYDFEASDKRYGWHFQNTKTNDCNSFYGDEEDYANIIGNIYDNPELMKGGAE